MDVMKEETPEEESVDWEETVDSRIVKREMHGYLSDVSSDATAILFHGETPA